MPVAVHISPKRMSKDDYQRVLGDLTASGAEPDGRLYHAAYGDDEVEIFEVWQSQEHFEAHRDEMFSLLQGAGVDAGVGRIRIEQLHSEHPD
jgi:quinol monooxygenase YgiN